MVQKGCPYFKVLPGFFFLHCKILPNYTSCYPVAFMMTPSFSCTYLSVTDGQNWIIVIQKHPHISLTTDVDIFCDEDGTKEFDKALSCPACKLSS